MKISKGMAKTTEMKTFHKNINLCDKDIILNSIRVYETNEDGCMKGEIPYIIQCAGKDYVTVLPLSTNENFVIKYERIVYGHTITVTREDYPSACKCDLVINLDNDFNIMK